MQHCVAISATVDLLLHQLATILGPGFRRLLKAHLYHRGCGQTNVPKATRSALTAATILADAASPPPSPK